MAKRGNIPPYEIMGSRSGLSSHGPRSANSPSNSPASSQTNPQAESSPQGVPRRNPPWWVGSSAPIVLRIPRGLAACAVAGVLMLIVLAYLVGTSRGKAAGLAQAQAEQAAATPFGGPRGVGSISKTDEQTDSAGPGQEVQIHTGERREPGFNYFRLVETDVGEGEGIAEFMARGGFDIQLVMLDNQRSCIVYAVDMGFRADELDSDTCKAYEAQLREWGRQWRRQTSGNTDFSQMYLDRF